MELLTSVAITHTTRLPDAARLARWRDDELVLACLDGSLLTVGASGGPGLPREELGFLPTALAVRAEQIICGGLDGRLTMVDAGGTSTVDLAATVTAVETFGDQVIAAAGSEVHLITRSRSTSLDLGIGGVTAMAVLVGRVGAIGGIRGMAWFDAGVADHLDRIDLPTVVAVAPDPGRRRVALGDLGGSVHLVCPEREDAKELTGYPDRVELLAWTSDGAGLCAVADDEITLWRTGQDGSVSSDGPDRLLGHARPIAAMAAGPNHGLVATGDTDGVVHLWAPLRLDAPVATIRSEGVVLALAWHRSGSALAVSTSEGIALLVDVRPGAVA